VAPSVMLRKLAAYRRQNQLDLALQELGRIERTLFMLDWLESPQLRRRCHAGLNKSEQRHFLAQVTCTFKQGRIAGRSAEAQQFRASGLNLVIAAILFWNSTYIADAIAHLRATEQSVPDAWLAHTSPLSWSTSASPAISCGSGPPRPQISAAPSISARRESLHDPRLSQSVRP
jgi:TnpA family transposase